MNATSALRRSAQVLLLALIALAGLPALPASAAQALVGVTVGTPEIDVTDGATPPVSLTATVVEPGAHYAEIVISPPSGSTAEPQRFYAPPDEAGTTFTSTDPWYQRPDDPVGVWRVSSVVLHSDAASTPFSNDDATDTITVVDGTDRTGPSITASSFAASPTAVDTTSSPKDVAVSVAVADASGVSEVRVVATPPSGASGASASLTRTTGTAADGTWAGTLTLPYQSENGTWALSVSAVDTEFQDSELTSSQLAAAGAPSSLSVTTVVDQTAPSLTSTTVKPSTVNRRYSASPIVSLAITDDVSGFAYGQVTVRLPSGATRPYYFDDFQRVSGTPKSGTYAVPVYVSSSDPVGTWTVSSVQLSDAAGRSRTVSNPAGGTFTVQDVVDTAAPSIGAISLSPTSVDTSAGSKPVTVSVAATDDSSGVSSVSVTLKSASGQRAYGYSSTPTTGSSLSGTWKVPVTISQWAQRGTWTVESVSVYDNASKYATKTSTATLSVTTTQEDLVAPAVTGISFVKGALNAQGELPVTVKVGVSDAVSGLQGGFVSLRSADGRQQTNGTLVVPSPGTKGGTFNASVLLPKGAAPGDWRVSSIFLYDRASNTKDWTTAALDGKSIVTRLAVTGTADDAAPKLTAWTLPTSVNTGTTTALTATFTVTDNLTGLGSGYVVATSPDGRHHASASFGAPERTSGTATNGTYKVVLRFDKYVQAGTWLVQTQLYDVRGNQVGYPGTAYPSGTPRLAVTAPSDKTLPALAGLTLPTTLVDTNTAGKAFNAGVKVSDAASGVAWATVTFRSPTGKRTLVGYGNSLSAGTPQSGTVAAAVQVPRWTEDGTWSVVQVELGDVAGNRRTYDAAALDAMTTLPRTVKVDAANDTALPVLSSMALAPTTVDTRTTDGRLTVKVGAADAASGIVSLRVEVVDPSTAPRTISGSASLTVGTAQKGTWEAAVVLPRGVLGGTWKISKVTITDEAGNTRTYTHTTLPTTGVVKTFSVTGTADTKGPTSASFTVRTPTVDVRTVGKEVEFLVQASDAGSGFSSGHFQLVSPSGQTRHSGYFSSYHLRTGTAANGTYLAPVFIPKFTEDGAWKVTQLFLTDGLGNSSVVPLTGKTVTVDGAAAAPAAPSWVGARAGFQKVVAHWGDVDNRGTLITKHRLQVRRTSDGVVVKTVDVPATAESGAVTGLANGTSYYVTVAALHAGGLGGTTASGPMTPGVSPPDPPTDVRVTTGTGSATVSWKAPLDNGGSPITGYVVYLYDAEGWDLVAHRSVSASTLSTTFTGLPSSGGYHAYVEAVNAKGSSGDGWGQG